jgi:alanyl-tRNA synthetase
MIGIEGSFTTEVAKIIVKNMSGVYPELAKNEQFIYSELDKEEKKFGKVLSQGLKKFENVRIQGGFGSGVSGKKAFGVGPGKVISGRVAFDLYQTYGFPIELIEEEADRINARVDRKGFNEEFKKHQKISRKGAEKKFKGGLGDQSEQTIKYHTAAHLLHESLRRVLGDHVYQRGANINAERIRFDFSHPEKMTPKEIKKVEDSVNEQIKSKLSIIETTTTVSEAKSEGAVGIFDEKYGEKVKVYSIGGPLDSKDAFSKEICGGPHVKNTSELGHFKIKKEQSSSAGIRRIKAILE